jgi:Protein of unknown function (DUF4233)
VTVSNEVPDRADSPEVEAHTGMVPELTEEDLADRRQRANRATRGAMAGLLCLEAFVVLLVPRTIAQTSTGLSTTMTFVLVGFAIVLIATGFMLRRPWGIGLASALQVVLALTIVLVPLFAIVVIIFLSIWWFMARTRQQLVGTPTGWRMFTS